jgi:hypothetical protein
VGQLLFFRLNRSGAQNRGHGFLIEHLDWLDMLDQFLFQSLKGFAARNRWFLSVKMEGKTQEELEGMQQSFTMPDDGSARLHNEKVEYSTVSPDLGAMEVDKALETIQTFIVGAKGYPMTWFGTGEDANRASASEMAVPTFKMLKALQKGIKRIIRKIARFILDQAVIGKQIALGPEERFWIDVTMTDFERKDAAVLSTAFQQIMAALQVAMDQALVSPETAKRVVDMLLLRLGIDVPADETIEDLQKEHDKRAEENMKRQAEMAYDQAPAAPGDDNEDED